MRDRKNVDMTGRKDEGGRRYIYVVEKREKMYLRDK